MLFSRDRQAFLVSCSRAPVFLAFQERGHAGTQICSGPRERVTLILRGVDNSGRGQLLAILEG